MEMIPTAKQFVDNWQNAALNAVANNEEVNLEDYFIQFAKLHTEAALKARDRLYQTYFNEINWTKDNKKFIQDSYSLENIK